MADKMTHCFAHPEQCKPEVFHCRNCIVVRQAARVAAFVGFAVFLYLYWGHAH